MQSKNGHVLVIQSSSQQYCPYYRSVSRSACNVLLAGQLSTSLTKWSYHIIYQYLLILGLTWNALRKRCPSSVYTLGFRGVIGESISTSVLEYVAMVDIRSGYESRFQSPIDDWWYFTFTCLTCTDYDVKKSLVTTSLFMQKNKFNVQGKNPIAEVF